jgi:hypothetical protein
MQLRQRTSKLTARLRADDGVTMLLALFVLVVTSLILSAAYVAVFSDTQLSRNDVDQGRALAAAQAGIQAYNYQLNQNENYWQTCAPLGNTGAVGFNGLNGNGFVTVPGSTDTGGGSESYFVKPLPASTAPSTDNQCDPSNSLTTMIEGPAANTASGSFRIMSTGHSGNVTRTIVAQYKPPSFLNYVYYTDFETLDPTATGDPGSCAVHYPNRGSQCSPPGSSAPYGAIDFITGDTINGPLHSEDSLAICGDPIFGRPGDNDAIQAAAAPGAPGGYYSTCNNPGPVFNTPSGGINTSSTSITPPASNTSLLSVTETSPVDYNYVGKTTIVLSGKYMYVTNTAAGLNGTTPIPDPPNGVIYVSTPTGGSCSTYTPYNPSYTSDATTNCGNVYVSGTYSTPLTIASDNDIIIDGNICTTTVSGTCSGIAPGGTPTGNALLGLIANDFVRVSHPVSGTASNISTWCSASPPGNGTDPVTNGSGSLPNPVIYAAILSVRHSFIVDNYTCGAALGTLTVYGAIAQLFRGTVGYQNNGNMSGYDKSYNYDDRLANEEPPYFLNPVSAQWFVARQTECNSSTAC